MARPPAVARRVRSTLLQDRLTDSILDAAATVFAEGGTQASMADIAEAAGVSRSTLYRQFATRDALLTALYAQALTETIARIKEARLDTVSVEEGIARLARTLISVGSRYLVLVGNSVVHQSQLEHQIQLEQESHDAISGLFERGRAEGLLRNDVPQIWLETHFATTVLTGLRMRMLQHAGDEETAATVVSVFLNGARAAT